METFWEKVGLVIGAYLAYQGLKFLYRVTLHPLAKFPGPKLAASSWLYEFYYDVVNPGTYTDKIVALHQQYGPIVRINPEELHCNDPAFIDQIYAVLESGGTNGGSSLTASAPRHRCQALQLSALFGKRSWSRTAS